jgi:predicted phage terminase large subunit-like protein
MHYLLKKGLIPWLVKNYGEDFAKAYLRREFSKPENKLAFFYICFAHHVKVLSPSFHSDLLTMFSLDENVGIAAPRGHAKSTMLMVHLMWLIVNGYKHYIIYISDSYTQALEHVQALQYELEYNQTIKWLYGSFKTDEWAEGEFVTKNDVKIVAKGQGMKIRGLKHKQYRPDEVAIDDLENDELVANSDRRRKLKNWFKLGVLPAMAKEEGKIDYVGTILHGDSLLSQIVNKNEEFAGWKTAKYQAISEGKALWPQMWTIEELEAMRSNPSHPKYMGHIAFAQEYQNEPISEEEAIIKRRWIQYIDSVPEMERVIITVDPAISKNDTADFTAIEAWGLGIDGHVYCLEVINKRLSFQEQGYEIRAIYHRHNADEIMIEEVAYQQALKEHDKLADLPVRGVKVVKDKRTRLVVVSKWFEVGHVHLKSVHDALAEQLIGFGSSAHDDMVDACTMGIFQLKSEYGTITEDDYFFG